jgi:hypothetical protein
MGSRTMNPRGQDEGRPKNTCLAGAIKQTLPVASVRGYERNYATC